MADDGIVLRKPATDDGARLHRLVRECPPLDENSVYCNVLQCAHFSDTACVAEKDGALVGFVTGYLHPRDPSVYFLWQVGVHPEAAGHGLGKRLIQAILARDVCRGIETLHTTITPSNEASRRLFASFARDEGAEMTEEVLFTEMHLGGGGKEPEDLFRIGPLSTPPR